MSARWARCRRVAGSIVSHVAFDKAILVLILANCVMLALDNPLDSRQSRMQRILAVLDAVRCSCALCRPAFPSLALSVAVSMSTHGTPMRRVVAAVACRRAHARSHPCTRTLTPMDMRAHARRPTRTHARAHARIRDTNTHDLSAHDMSARARALSWLSRGE
jgi:hypothetical protein